MTTLRMLAAPGPGVDACSGGMGSVVVCGSPDTLAAKGGLPFPADGTGVQALPDS
jgi:hypothetical protein